ncbi:hypothetical protein [Kaistia sp. UC242_56]|uniref:hypothetical protein n=1 Tax=Kaistia sp. UC242_56 TaxID=3374625 RepID=UPI0037A9483B
MLPGLAALPPFRKQITPYTVTLTTGSGNWPLPADFNELTVEGWGGGAAGAGTDAGPPSAAHGTATTFGPCTAPGGLSGYVAQATNGNGIGPGGAGGAMATGGDTNFAGIAGGDSKTWNFAGKGADAPDGGGIGAAGRTTGGGSAALSTTPGAGGAGKYDTSGSTCWAGGGGGSGSKFKRVFSEGYFTGSVPYSVGVGGTKTGTAGAGARGEIRIIVS